MDLVPKYYPPFFKLHGSLKNFLQTMAIKNIIPQYQANLILADEFFPQDKCLSQSLRPWLLFIGNS